MAWAVIRRSPTEKKRVQSQANPCGICGWSSVTGRHRYPSTSIFRRQ